MYDWVVNANGYGNPLNLSGNSYSLIPLTYEGTLLPQDSDEIGMWQRFQDQAMYIRAVRGRVFFRLQSTWSDISNEAALLSVRLTKMKMDALNGQIYEPSANGYDVGEAHVANDEFIHEEKQMAFSLQSWTTGNLSTGGPVWQFDLNVKCNRKLEPLEQLVLVVDNEIVPQINGKAMTVYPYVRTLLSAR